MKIILVGLALVAMTRNLTADEIFPTVETPMGTVRGYWQLSRDGRPFQAYEGIPYAQPPIGKLRFEPPQPISAWIGTLPATKPGSMCLQYQHLVKDPNDRVTGTEDCLYLNVYTPAETTDASTGNYVTRQSLPVIVYIHSGAFQFGDGATHRPNYLMDHDVILVTLNYRLGPLGFLSTQDSVVPGNMGLKDQSLALAWVSKNIESFGGDTKRITITGLSAGAASVHYHYLSPMSRGLFHRGMSVSGTALDCWTQTEASVEKAKKLGALMGCPTSKSDDLVGCLKTRPAKSILEAEGEFMGWLYNPFTPFGPVVEKESNGAFIEKSPIDIIVAGEAADLPWITSVVTEEGLYPAAEFIANDERMAELDENWELIAPHLLDYNYTIPRTEQAKIAREIRKHYLGDKKIDGKSAEALVHMIGDRQFVVDGEKAARYQARANKSPVRFYQFGYRGDHSLSDSFTGTKKNFGVSHADDLAYVLAADWNAALTSQQDIRMSQDMVRLWTSYASTGIPEVGIAWPRVDPSKELFEYLRISGPGSVSIESSADLGEKKFWRSIAFDENKPSRNFVAQKPRRAEEAAKQRTLRSNDQATCQF